MLSLRTMKKKRPDIPAEPEPIEDPEQLIAYVEQFYSIARTGPGSAAWQLGIQNIRTDLRAIKNEAVRDHALELLRQMQSGDYVLRRNPEMKDTVVLPAIQKLIDYLKANLK